MITTWLKFIFIKEHLWNLFLISVICCGNRTLSSLSNKRLSFHHTDEKPFWCNDLSYTKTQFLNSFVNIEWILNIPVCLSLRAFLHISILAEWKGTYLSWGEATNTTFLKYWRPAANKFIKCIYHNDEQHNHIHVEMHFKIYSEKQMKNY